MMKNEVEYQFVKRVLETADKMCRKRTIEASIAGAFIKHMGPVVDAKEKRHLAALKAKKRKP